MFRHVIKGRNLGVQTKRGKSNVYIKNVYMMILVVQTKCGKSNVYIKMVYIMILVDHRIDSSFI